MSSSFVEQAAAEAAEATIIPGEPEADALLASARQKIYHWPVDFGGFRAGLRFDDDQSSYEGQFHCAGSRSLTIDLPELDDSRWLAYQFEEMTSHREAPSVSKMASRTGCAMGDWDPVYGRRIDFLGDKMASFYRVKDGKLCQIGRSYKNQDFIINIDAHQNCDGGWAASFYSAYYWAKDTKALLKTETYLDCYQAYQGIYLPVERRVSEASATGLRCRRITLVEPKLL